MKDPEKMTLEEYHEWERAGDQLCLDYEAGKIDRATARAGHIKLGFDPGVVDDGLDEQDRQRVYPAIKATDEAERK